MSILARQRSRYLVRSVATLESGTTIIRLRQLPQRHRPTDVEAALDLALWARRMHMRLTCANDSDSPRPARSSVRK